MEEQHTVPDREAIAPSATSRSRLLPRLWLALLIAGPVVSSVLFAMRDYTSPPLEIRGDRPSLVFESYLVDTGLDPVRAQPVVTTFFTFTNRGDSPVTITELIPGCSCVKPQTTLSEVAPGESGRIMLPLDTRREPAGPREYIVNVRFTDPKPREVTLTCKTVLPEKQIEIEPRVLMVMGRITSADRDLVTISDYRPERAANPMKITGVSSSISIVSAQAAGTVEKEGLLRQAIEVSYTDDIPPGNHKGVISIMTDDPAFPVLQMPVIMNAGKRSADDTTSITPESARLTYSAENFAEADSNDVAISIPAAWKVTHLDTVPSAVVATVGTTNTVNDKSVIRLKLSLNELPPAGVERGTITLHAMNGDKPEMLTVPLMVIRRSSN